MAVARWSTDAWTAEDFVLWSEGRFGRKALLGRTVIHHARGGDGEVRSTSFAEGVISMMPPGLDLDVTALFHPASDDERT